MKKTALLIFVLALCFAAPVGAGAATDFKGVQVEQILSRGGMSCRTVNMMTRDSKGRLWVGLPTGVGIFVNGSVTALNILNIDGNAVYIGNVSSIVCGQRALIASDNCLIDYDPESGSASILHNAEGRKIATEYLLLDGQDVIFYEYSSSRLYLYSFQLKTVRTLFEFPEKESHRFRKIIKAGEGKYILAGDRLELHLYDASTGECAPICESLGAISSRTVTASPEGVLWAINQEGALKRMDLAQLTQMPDLRTEPLMIDTEGVTSIEAISGNLLIITTLGDGVTIVNTSDGTVARMTEDCLSNASCSFLNQSNGDLVFGTVNNGIVIWKNSIIRTVDNRSFNPSNILNTRQETCATQGKDGEIWFGTSTSGVFSYDELTGEIKRVPDTRNRRISGLCRYDEDRLLVTIPHQGVYLLDMDTMELTPSDLYDGDRQMLLSSPSGLVLSFNGDSGHFIFDPASGERRRIRFEGRASDDLSTVRLAYPMQSYVAIASENAVYQLDYASLNLYHVYSSEHTEKRVVKALAADSKGRLLFSGGTMVMSYDPSESTTTAVLDFSYLGNICSIAVDASDRVWVSTLGGVLACYDHSTGSAKYFSYADGVDYGGFSDYFSFVSSSGKAYFPLTIGLLSVDLNQEMPQSDDIPKVSCLSIEIDGKMRRFSGGRVESVAIPLGSNSVALSFGVSSSNPIEPVYLQYSLERGGRVLYTLETTDTRLVLPKIGVGAYSLRASPLTRDGLAEPSELLSIHVRNSVFKSLWLYALLALLMTAVAVLITRGSMRRESKARMKAESRADMVRGLKIPAARYSDVEFETNNLTLMIVDDSADICQHLRSEMSEHFRNVITAHDGKEAIAMALDRHPDVIITEILMPVMNGFELCHAVKSEPSLQSCTVIFLSSCSGPESQSIACQMGADGFVPKPYDTKVLYGLVRSILKHHNDLRIRYSTSGMSAALSEKQAYTSADDMFVSKLNAFLKENISDPDLGVDMIVDHMCVSRTTLFNKMNSLLGMSAVKYIRRLRIDTAKDLLTHTDKSISEVASDVGFSESQYFSTVFKQETGVPPSAFRK